MEQHELQNLYQWKSRQARCLLEADGLTGQLEEALNRGDKVSVQMIINMRREPVQQALELEDAARAYLLELPEADAIRGNELLNGANAEDPAEESLAAQVAGNRRKLEKIREVDRRLSLKLGGRRSFYQIYRD